MLVSSYTILPPMVSIIIIRRYRFVQTIARHVRKKLKNKKEKYFSFHLYSRFKVVGGATPQ